MNTKTPMHTVPPKKLSEEKNRTNNLVFCSVHRCRSRKKASNIREEHNYIVEALIVRSAPDQIYTKSFEKIKARVNTTQHVS